MVSIFCRHNLNLDKLVESCEIVILEKRAVTDLKVKILEQRKQGKTIINGV